MALRALILTPGVPCALCGLPIVDPRQGQVDHRIPRSVGGSDGLDNLVATHARCNLRKGAGYVAPTSPPAVIAMPAARGGPAPAYDEAKRPAR
jgi:hypothetical protein